MKNKLSNFIFSSLIFILIGQAVPLIFIFLDLVELGLSWNFANAFEIYTSQTIYVFSSISVPITFFVFYLQFRQTKLQKVFFNGILNEMSELVVVFDEDLRPVFKNISFLNSTIQENLSELIVSKDLKHSFEWSSGEGASASTFICNFNQLKNQSGHLLILNDVSEFKKKDELLKIQEQSIISSSRLAALGEMAAGLAHEINNPLAVIIGRTEIILNQIAEGPVSDAEVLRVMKKINEMSIRISKIITSMRKISKVNHNSELAVINLAEVVQDVLNLSLERSRSLLITLDSSAVNQESVVISNFSLLSQVVINLVNNSMDELIKNPEDNRTIWISTESSEGRVLFKIRDSGLGIPASIRDKVFQPFFTTKEIGMGTGLGLSISKNLMENMGGKLELSPDLTQTCFILSFKTPEID